MKLSSYLLLVVIVVEAQHISAQLTFPLTSQSVNGSSATGHCTGATRLSDRYHCDDPTSSVAYDGHIPTLIGLDGNMWASQLLTINASSAVLVFDFTGTPNFQVRRVEMVVFNCPQWGISLQSVVLTDSDLYHLGVVNPTLSSCDSLVRVCIPNLSITSFQAVLGLEFITRERTDWIHIAEVGFHGDSPTCPEEGIITEPTAATTPTTAMAAGNGSRGSETTQNVIQSLSCTQCPSCFTSTTLASVITAITTALLATLIFVLLQIALCKYHPKFKPGRHEPAASAGREEIAVYHQVDESGKDESGKGVAMSDHTYAEIRYAVQETKLKLKENEAYNSFKHN